MTQDNELYNQGCHNPDWSVELHPLDLELSDLLSIDLNKMTLVLRKEWPESIGQILNHIFSGHIKESCVVERVENVYLEEASLSLIGE